ncbi:MAG: DNA polymerase III subunit beta [Phycisphaerales bacterium]|jgi:DNA polymerase III subunit beta|nr:DNA polymerase III subunit beta [Phycisphaerales bacterium]|tara:strand:+ start:53525 stop:54694 length:1170 start_codon:yes stop_codon:yes gene_type:complete
MKVICERAALLEAVNQVSGVVASRSPRPQLTCIKLTATNDAQGAELTLSGTDAEIALSVRIGRVEVEREGSLLVPADKLRQIVSAEDNEPTLTIEASGETTHIRGADAHFQLHGFDAADFPQLADYKGVSEGSAASPAAKSIFALPAGTLDTLIARTLFAAARENSRYAINGVLLVRDGKKLDLIATDGRRLAKSHATIDSKGDPAQCILPSKALSMIQKMTADENELVHIAVTDNQAVIVFGEDPTDARATLSTNLVEGTFPPYEDVIPKDQDIKVSFKREILASAVKRAALLTNEESRGVRLAFNGGEKSLELSSRAPEMGEATINVELSSYDGDDIEIGFNPAFITDALKVITDAEVMIELKSGNKPGLFKAGSDFLYVVMPVNLS